MRLSSVLHMGDRGLYGSRVVFCWNHKIFWRSWCAVVGLPCAVRWVYAHGSKTEATSDIAFPHDSAVSADAECARVCNTHTWDTRASVRASASWEFGMRAAPGPCRHQQTDTPVGSRCLHRPGARGHRGPRPSRRPLPCWWSRVVRGWASCCGHDVLPLSADDPGGVVTRGSRALVTADKGNGPLCVRSNAGVGAGPVVHRLTLTHAARGGRRDGYRRHRGLHRHRRR